MNALLTAEGLGLPGRLRPMDLQLQPGEVACLIGPNGSGKTSLLHAIAGIGRPSGRVTIAGDDIRRLPVQHRSRLLAFMPASRDVRWPLAARDLIALGGAGPDDLDWVIRALELEPFAERRVDQLSTGERSRVLLARALAPRPKLLLLDEPLANLDPLWQLKVAALLRDQVAQNDQAALIAMHDLDSAASLGDRLIVMERGRMVSDGRPADVLGGPVVPQVFGIERGPAGWQAVKPPEDRRSSP